jgi:uncharacterized membrane protein HdeD (DUF308 family)
MFANILSRYWWTTLLRGLIWVMVGVFLFVKPAIGLMTLALTFGVLVLADGIATIVSAIGGRKEHENWGILLLAGLAGVGVGLLTLFNPGITALVLLFYMAIWAIATGVLELVAAIKLRKEIRGEGWLVLAGLLSIAFGVILMARPGVGALSVLWLIAAYAIGLGVSLIVLSLKSRRFVREIGDLRERLA